MHPFGPFGVESPVWFFVFWFVHPDSLALGVLHEVTPTGALIDPDGIKPAVDGGLGLSDQLGEGGIICKSDGLKSNFVNANISN